MQRATLIYNPLAGPLNCAEMMEDVARYWRSREWDVSVKATEYAGHATELARQAAAQGFQLVFAAGGDGTQGEVATGLAFTDTVMATIPIGTGNSLAKEMQMPRPSRRQPNRAIDAAEALYRGGYFRPIWVRMGMDAFGCSGAVSASTVISSTRSNRVPSDSSDSVPPVTSSKARIQHANYRAGNWM